MSSCVLAPTTNRADAGAPIERNRLRLIDARFENQPLDAQVTCRFFEVVEDLLGDSTPATLGLDVHPLHLGCRGVQLAQRTAANRATIGPCHHERADAGLEMLGLEVRAKSLVRRIPAGQVRV